MNTSGDEGLPCFACAGDTVPRIFKMEVNGHHWEVRAFVCRKCKYIWSTPAQRAHHERELEIANRKGAKP